MEDISLFEISRFDCKEDISLFEILRFDCINDISLFDISRSDCIEDISLSLQEVPFIQWKNKTPEEPLYGNDRFDGMCIDILKEISELLNFKYNITLVPDGKFGSKKSWGWTGMMNELIHNVNLIFWVTVTLCFLTSLILLYIHSILCILFFFSIFC